MLSWRKGRRQDDKLTIGISLGPGDLLALIEQHNIGIGLGPARYHSLAALFNANNIKFR